MATVAAKWEVSEAAPKIGSVIRTDKETLLSGEKAAEIREIMEARGVIVFPQINLSDDEQIAFTHTLGTFAHEDGEGSKDGKDAVYPITMDESINPIASYLKGAFFWHIDGTMSEKPILASIMSARALAQEGGETDFCNTYAAYDDLPEDEKLAIADLKVVHAMWRSQLYWRPEPSFAELQNWMARGSNTLPLVWKHRSGRQSLVLGATALEVEGMDTVESEKLLVRLRDWATQPQFCYRHTWSLGDMVIWDNTGTMHRALPYDHKSGRLMMRTKLEGEEAFA
ncbi:TauD/TfdA dioxygenase family protein [Novosphingobium album (ex Liu et al. 2023)]|uniref:TauD/TfdA family dioxygenase n=1 Tax=Novosphingobium album (ex Liu et al. 2023) TaxID=3031130 RepID=A0ABT5WJ99_9SPHN|nr:TauD/TfdA family dioxygenase [Novosphingobium album (ex Liu et al. 2023)]MDE8650123.1 TauD/TfdA family dioxygenase [Novosphingobium album (ex Liu et al. 2023)]